MKIERTDAGVTLEPERSQLAAMLATVREPEPEIGAGGPVGLEDFE